MQLRTEPPAWVCQAVCDAGFRVFRELGPIARLEGKNSKIHGLKRKRVKLSLWVHEFDLVARTLHKRRPGFWADAYPVEGRWAGECAVCFHAHLESERVACVKEWAVELQKGFAACEDNERAAVTSYAWLPRLGDVLGEVGGGLEAAAAWAVCANKVGVAEFA